MKSNLQSLADRTGEYRKEDSRDLSEVTRNLRSLVSGLHEQQNLSTQNQAEIGFKTRYTARNH